MWYLATIFVLVSCILQVCLADCGICNEYGIACVNERNFHICVARGSSELNVDKSVLYSCSEDEICTDLREVCVPRNSSVSTAFPSCTDYCDVCEDGQSFACTSRTTFALCQENEITSIVGTCPPSLICNIYAPVICVEECGPYNIICDREFPSSTLRPPPLPTPRPTTPPAVTPTETPPETPTVTAIPTVMTTPTVTTTPTVMITPTVMTTPILRRRTAQTPWEVCAERKMAGKFPYDNDSSCSKYVYCLFQGSVLVAVPNTCAINTYFNQGTQLCEPIKPNWCI